MTKFFEKDDLFASLVASVLIFGAFNAISIESILLSYGAPVTGLVTTGVFFTLYKVVLWIYREWIWALVHRKDLLSGSWVYVLTTEHDNRESIGYFSIEHTRSGLRFYDASVWYEAQTNPTRTNSRGSWTSRASGKSAEEFWVLYEMQDGPSAEIERGIASNTTTPGSTGNIKSAGSHRGLITLNGEGSPVSNLTGRFQDLDERRNKRGTMTCAKVDEAGSPKTIRNLIEKHLRS